MSKPFTENPESDFRRWIVMCTAIGSIVLLGALAGLLREASIVAIGTFVVVRGLIPYRRFSALYTADAQNCREEKEVLQDLDFSQAATLQEIHASDAGTLFCLVQFVEGNKHRMSKQDAIKAYLSLVEREWADLLEPLIDSVEQAPNLGLFGTIIGMQLAMAELAIQGADPQGMVVAIGVALQTTLAGCAGGFVLLGLRSRAEGIVQKHLSEIELVASQMLDDEGVE